MDKKSLKSSATWSAKVRRESSLYVLSEFHDENLTQLIIFII